MGWVDPTTSDAESVLDDLIATAAAAPGTEQGLAAALRAVQLGGFARPEVVWR